MKITWGDFISSILLIVGGVTIFARLQSYSWWLIGSWKGALGVISVIGLGILLTNAAELFRLANGTVFAEALLWLIAVTVAITSLIVVTSKAEFVTTAILIGLAWAAQFGRHLWVSAHHHGPRYAAVH